MPNKSGRVLRIASIVAITFGILTVLSGGIAVLGWEPSNQLLGNIVVPILWFNFLSGFAYLLAGAGLWAVKQWSVWLSALISLSIVCAAAYLTQHILVGGAYEVRTVGALIFRGFIWLAISWVAHRHIGWNRNS
jgi:hypothetical protein